MTAFNPFTASSPFPFIARVGETTCIEFRAYVPFPFSPLLGNS